VFRSSLILITLASASLYAGQIQLSGTGPVNNNVSGFGLTGSATTGSPGYVQGPGPGTTNCAGSQYNGSACASAVVNQDRKGNYVTQLFAGATGLSVAPPDAFTGVDTTAGKITGNFTDSTGAAVKYDMMNAQNGSNGYSGSSVCNLCIDANFWSSNASATTADLVIPVGLYNVDSVYTMLNDYWGLAGAQNITVNFCFSATSNGSCASPVSVALTNGVEVSAAVDCNPLVSGDCPTTTNSASIATTLAPSTLTASGVTVKADSVYSATYTSIPTLVPTGAANPSPWAGSTGGTVFLDEQQFIFTSAQYSGMYLSYIDISDAGTAWSASNPGGSRFALSAVTVDQTPEPSTILLLVGGFGVIGLGRLRRRS